jgi:hypothetical protein
MPQDDVRVEGPVLAGDTAAWLYRAHLEGTTVNFSLVPKSNPATGDETTWTVRVEGLEEMYTPGGITSREEAYDVALKLAGFAVGLDRERSRIKAEVEGTLNTGRR